MYCTVDISYTYSFICIALAAYAQDVDYLYIVSLIQICMFKDIGLINKVRYMYIHMYYIVP